MKIGSVVKCVKKSNWDDHPEYNVTTPVVDKVYIIRGLFDGGVYGISIYLEEIINGPLPVTNVEPSFDKNIFVELLPPEECAIEHLFDEKIDISEFV